MYTPFFPLCVIVLCMCGADLTDAEFRLPKSILVLPPFKMRLLYRITCAVIAFATMSDALPEGDGRGTFLLNKDLGYVSMSKSLFKDSQIFIQIMCNSKVTGAVVSVEWVLQESQCWEDYASLLDGALHVSPMGRANLTYSPGPSQAMCIDNIILASMSRANDNQTKNVKQTLNPAKRTAPKPIYTIEKDGLYLLTLHMSSDVDFAANVTIEMQGHYGYLSAASWPLLPFYGAMCLIYVVFGVAWLVVSFCQWRDLLRIQFWIGGVILLGMLEKAVFYAEYQSINSTGYSTSGAAFLAELVSCAKRSLARMLVIIVSLGFGIVKPRLGPMLHRVVIAGALYFILAAIESYKRIMGRGIGSNDVLVASVPLALVDSAFCWWIFSNLVQTMRTLRLRRNLVKLSLYRHFSNTLYFSVLASVCFMLYSIKFHRFAECITDWKELWVDEAYWHILFSVILLVIMILWRPTNNNQRYAFTPLLDNPEDEDEEEEQFVSDAFGLKMRGNNSASSPKSKSSTSVEDDLKWVEENIPASLNDTALPILDSDEEVMNTKFEVSKMQ